MARFVFKLAGVLKQREHIEQERQRELAEKHAIFARLEQELRELDATMQQGNTDLRTHHLTGRLDMSFIAAHRRFTASTTAKAMAVVRQMAVAKKASDEAQGRLIEATKQRKIIEKLRDKQQDRWKLDQDQRERAAGDEVGTQLAYEQMAVEAAGVTAEDMRFAIAATGGGA